MRTIIQSTNAVLDPPARHRLEAELLRSLIRHARDIDVATAYVRTEEDGTWHCRLAVQTLAGARQGGESRAATPEDALRQASSPVIAGLQRELLHRGGGARHF